MVGATIVKQRLLLESLRAWGKVGQALHFGFKLGGRIFQRSQWTMDDAAPDVDTSLSDAEDAIPDSGGSDEEDDEKVEDAGPLGAEEGHEGGEEAGGGGVSAPAPGHSDSAHHHPLAKSLEAWARSVPDPGRSTPERRNTGGRFDSGFRDDADRAPFKTAVGAFDQLFSGALVAAIVDRTNPHLAARKLAPTTVDELYVFLAMLMAKSIKKQPSERSYTDTTYFGESCLRPRTVTEGPLESSWRETIRHQQHFSLARSPWSPCGVPSPAQSTVPPSDDRCAVPRAEGVPALLQGRRLRRGASPWSPLVRPLVQSAHGPGQRLDGDQEGVPDGQVCHH